MAEPPREEPGEQQEPQVPQGPQPSLKRANLHKATLAN